MTTELNFFQKYSKSLVSFLAAIVLFIIGPCLTQAGLGAGFIAVGVLLIIIAVVFVIFGFIFWLMAVDE